MPELNLKVAKTLAYKRPEIENGYTDQTLHVNISDADISHKAGGAKNQGYYLSAEKAMTCGCCGTPSRRTPAGMIPTTPFALPAGRWGAHRSTPVPVKVLSPPFLR